MGKIDYVKKLALDSIDSSQDRIKEVSSTIHDYAEVGTKEFRSSSLLCAELVKHGFTVERNICTVSNAFRAVMKGKPGPTIALIAEYDALPDVGHACGHNIIGTSATFAAISLSNIVKKLGGSIQVLGTPDEEGDGGKIPMLRKGAFRGVDAVIETHPFVRNAPWWPTVALDPALMIRLEGREAHYATPNKGANALDAALAILSTLNVLKHGLRPDVLIGYTLNADSATPVIVPGKAQIHVTLKATDIEYLKTVADKVKECANGISKSFGVRSHITDPSEDNTCFEESVPNLTLIDAVQRNFAKLGVSAEKPADSIKFRSFYSTDYGNVSRRFPGVNFAVAITHEGVSLHTTQFAKAAISKKGQEALITATKVMAMTAIDLIAEPGRLAKAKDEFQEYRSDEFVRVPLQPVFG